MCEGIKEEIKEEMQDMKSLHSSKYRGFFFGGGGGRGDSDMDFQFNTS